MTQDVYSQLSRRITEAEHRGELELLAKELFRQAKADALSTAEFMRLAGEVTNCVEMISQEAADVGQ